MAKRTKASTRRPRHAASRAARPAGHTVGRATGGTRKARAGRPKSQGKSAAAPVGRAASGRRAVEPAPGVKARKRDSRSGAPPQPAGAGTPPESTAAVRRRAPQPVATTPVPGPGRPEAAATRPKTAAPARRQPPAGERARRTETAPAGPAVRADRPARPEPAPAPAASASPPPDASTVVANEEEPLLAAPTSFSLDLRHARAPETLEEPAEADPESAVALAAGDRDVRWEAVASVGDEAPGGDNPTPDQDVVDLIGRSLGVEYDDNEELRGADKIAERDRHRWELDPASAEDYRERGRS